MAFCASVEVCPVVGFGLWIYFYFLFCFFTKQGVHVLGKLLLNTPTTGSEICGRGNLKPFPLSSAVVYQLVFRLKTGKQY